MINIDNKCEVYIKDGILIIDYNNIRHQFMVNDIIIYFNNLFIEVKYNKENWLYCHPEMCVGHILPNGSKDHSILDFEDKYIEVIPEYTIKIFFGLIKKVIKEQKRIKSGWVKLKKEERRHIKTSNFRVLYLDKKND